jgi:molybdopterin converting factor small subunit
MSAMTIRVKLFAVLRDQAGFGEIDLEVERGATVAAAVHALGERCPQVRQTLSRTAKAVNLSAAGDDTVLNPGDELALLPPVSGG